MKYYTGIVRNEVLTTIQVLFSYKIHLYRSIAHMVKRVHLLKIIAHTVKRILL